MNLGGPLVTLVLFLAVLTACTDPTQPSGTGHASTAPMPGSTKVTIDWQDPGERWPTQWQLGYGSGPQELGIKWYREREPIVPSSAAALPGGSFAVVDPQHRRVVEVDAGGRIVRTMAKAAQVSSDVAWDPRSQRLLVIDDESKGHLLEVPADGRVRRVDMHDHVARLQPTDGGVFTLGFSSKRPEPRMTLLPTPLVPYRRSSTRSIALADGDTLTFASEQDGARWTIKRSKRWTTKLDLVGVNGPVEIAASLIHDLLVTGDTLVMAPLVGTLTGADVERKLVVISVDLRSGKVTSATQLAQCGLTMDENVVSRITARPGDGALYQFCVGSRSVELRRTPRA